MHALNKKTKSLHLIRGIAALIVVIYHSKFILWSGGELWLQNIGFHNYGDYFLFAFDMLSSSGAQCVLVFFVLSGFIIYHSFQNSDKDLRHFFVVRIIRIYIPFLFSLFVSVTVLFLVIKFNQGIAVNDVREYNTRLLSASNEVGAGSVFNTIFFLPGTEYAGFNFAYWSLLHEAIFYIAFPFYFYIGLRKRVFVFIACLLGYVVTENNVLYFQLYFLCGMFLYDYYLKNPAPFFTKRQLYLPLVFMCFCLTNLLVKLSLPLLADLTALATVIGCFDYLLYATKAENRLLKGLADMSFTLYLNHLWVLLIWYAICSRYFDSLIIYERYPYYMGIIVSLIVSWFLYRLVEEKSLVLIATVKSKWRKQVEIKLVGEVVTGEAK